MVRYYDKILGQYVGNNHVPVRRFDKISGQYTYNGLPPTPAGFAEAPLLALTKTQILLLAGGLLAGFLLFTETGRSIVKIPAEILGIKVTKGLKKRKAELLMD